MEMYNYLIISVIILNSMLVTKCDDDSQDLFDLSCINEDQCTQFAHPIVKTRCHGQQCECTTLSGKKIKCTPRSQSVNNIIGGRCPCQSPNSECGTKIDVCYCKRGYIPSADRRRCIVRLVPLNDDCELHCQCQEADYNSHCNKTSRKCQCNKHFLVDDGNCVLNLEDTCVNNSYCVEKYGENTKCSRRTQHCICTNGYYASHDKKVCLKPVKYNENCNETIQCISTMGPAGACVENVCQCSERHYPFENETPDGLNQTICVPIVERGDYCRYNEDCYQRNLPDADQTMACINGECNCKNGFNSYNDGECVKGSSAGIGLINYGFMLSFMITVIVFQCL